MLKELSGKVYAEVLSIDEIKLAIEKVKEDEGAEIKRALEFSKSVFQRQQTSLFHFKKLPRDEKTSYLSAVAGMREFYFKEQDWAMVIGFHLLFYKLLPTLTLEVDSVSHNASVLELDS